MIKLIKNELIKLFKKRSTYLILLIFLVLIIGFTYKYAKQIEEDPDGGYFLYEEEYINYYESNKNQIFEDRVSDDEYNKQILEELVSKYGYNSWQVDAFLIEYGTITEDIGINTEDYKDIERTYEEDDWRKFIKVLIEKLEKVDTKGDKDLENSIIERIEKLNSRLENNIVYEYDFLNDALESYYTNKSILLLRQSNLISYNKEIDIQKNEKGMKFVEYIIKNKKDVLNYRNARSNLLMFFNLFNFIFINNY